MNNSEEMIIFKDHENKHKINSPPNKFIIENNYEICLEENLDKLENDHINNNIINLERFSLSLDYNSSPEVDCFRNCLSPNRVKKFILHLLKLSFFFLILNFYF
jgi:hypothetical protein